MKKAEIIQKSIMYYKLANTEYQQNGDTNKRRDYIYQMITYLNLYDINKGRLSKSDFIQPLRDLKKEYYEELIFTPTLEDIDEMKYWYC